MVDQIDLRLGGRVGGIESGCYLGPVKDRIVVTVGVEGVSAGVAGVDEGAGTGLHAVEQTVAVGIGIEGVGSKGGFLPFGEGRHHHCRPSVGSVSGGEFLAVAAAVPIKVSSACARALAVRGSIKLSQVVDPGPAQFPLVRQSVLISILRAGNNVWSGGQVGSHFVSGQFPVPDAEFVDRPIHAGIAPVRGPDSFPSCSEAWPDHSRRLSGSAGKPGSARRQSRH